MEKETFINKFIEYDFDKFHKWVKSKNINLTNSLEYIIESLSNPKIFIIFDNKLRQKEIFSYIKQKDFLLQENLPQLSEYIQNKIDLINDSERLLSIVSSTLDRCSINTLPVNMQIWAYIDRYEKGIIYHLNSFIDSYQNMASHENIIIHHADIELKNSYGQTYTGYGAIEQLQNMVISAIKYLGYKHKLYDSNNRLILPAFIKPSDDAIYKCSSNDMLSSAWENIINQSQMMIKNNGHILELNREDDSNYFKNKNNKITKIFCIDYEYSDFDKYNLIAQDRLRFQNSETVMNLHYQMLNSPKPHFEIDSYEFNLCTTLANIENDLCIDPLEEKVIYKNLTFSDMAKGYCILEKIFDSSYEQRGKLISILNLYKHFHYYKFDMNKFNIIIDFLTLNKNSKDLFDTPLLRLENNLYYILPYTIISSNKSQCIISRLSTLNINIANKGITFENFMIKSLQKYNIKCRKMKFKVGKTTFEYDLVFIIDTKVFLIECKNRSYLFTNPVKLYDDELFLYAAAEQVLRLKDGLIKYPQFFKKEFGTDILSYEIVSIVLNSLPLSIPDKQNGVYFHDKSALIRFFQDKNIYSKTLENGQVIKRKIVHNLWLGDQPSSDDLIKQLEAPVQLEPYSESFIRSCSLDQISENTCCFHAFTLISPNSLRSFYKIKNA